MESANPFREGPASRATAAPCVLVIFGATGDLTHRKLLPALYNLAHEGELPPAFAVVGVARRPKTDAEFRAALRAGVEKFSRFRPLNPGVWDALAAGIHYHQADFRDATGYATLQRRLEQIDRDRGTQGRRLFYLATAPTEFAAIIRQLGDHGFGAQRIVVEKPFGSDRPTAQALNAEVAEVFAERQVFRIDHYLGKETVQNILTLRFANEIFEPLWNQKYVDHVQITVAESLGVEGRAGYYEQAGALRDMVANHMLQLLALTTMEPPVSLAAEDIRDEKVKALRAIKLPTTKTPWVVRGQYTAGAIAGAAVPGYRQETNVASDSTTETYVGLKLLLDNWRWAGVPFYLRHGKRLPKQVAEIAIQFKAPPAVLFARETAAPLQPNVLVLRIQPDEGIAIRMNAKVPGTTLNIQPVKMDFRYGGSFGARTPDAYERLLHDAIVNDATLFLRNDEIEAGWSVMDAVRAGWDKTPVPYEAGTWGPADNLGVAWRRP
jgi:glucose-6-phosphate 1-dehydrogenase